MKALSTLFKYLYELTGGFLSLILPFFIRKDDRLVIFTSFHGYGYRGNTKRIYEELIRTHSLNGVWLSRDPQLTESLKKRFGNEKAEHMHSIRGLKKLAAASALLFTHGTSDFAFLFMPRRSLRIQTYHGLPTKRGEFLRPNPEKKPGLIHKCILQYRFSPITHFLSSSPLVTRLFSERFGIHPDRFIETGYPVYDSFFENNPVIQMRSDLWPSAPDSSGLILYAPTFRRKEQTRWFPFDDFDLMELVDLLKEKNLLFALRQHPNDHQDLSHYCSIDPRIVIADQSVSEDVSDLIKLSSVVISDYSSITLEALLCDTPSLYLPYDLDSYERGLILPYSELIAGPSADTGKEFLNQLRIILEQPESWQEERMELRKRFLVREMGRSTEKVVEFLCRQLGSDESVKEQ